MTVNSKQAFKMTLGMRPSIPEMRIPFNVIRKLYPSLNEPICFQSDLKMMYPNIDSAVYHCQGGVMERRDILLNWSVDKGVIKRANFPIFLESFQVDQSIFCKQQDETDTKHLLCTTSFCSAYDHVQSKFKCKSSILILLLTLQITSTLSNFSGLFPMTIS